MENNVCNIKKYYFLQNNRYEPELGKVKHKTQSMGCAHTLGYTNCFQDNIFIWFNLYIFFLSVCINEEKLRLIDIKQNS